MNLEAWIAVAERKQADWESGHCWKTLQDVQENMANATLTELKSMEWAVN